MPSSLPSPSDDYAAPPDMALTRAAWDAALTSVGTRLRALEGISSDWEALIAAGTTQALEMIGANVEPQLGALSATLASLQTEVNVAQDVVAQINSGSVPATAVSETAGRIWLTPALRDGWDARPTTAAVEALISAAVAALIGGATPAALDTLAEIAAALGNDANLAATLTASIALKADASALATLAPLASPALTGAPTAPTPLAAEDSARLATTAWVRDRIDDAPQMLVKIHDTAIASAVAYVEHTVDFGVYALALTVVETVSATATGAITAQVRSASGDVTGGFASLAYSTAPTAAQTVSGYGLWGPKIAGYTGYGATPDVASSYDRARIYPASGSLDAGRIITYGIRR